MKQKINLWEEKIKKKDVVLDIGCWDGGRIKKMIQKCNIYGMDIDSSKFDKCSGEVFERIKRGDATHKIPFEQKFDWIFIEEVLEHIEDVNNLLKNVYNSLKPKGKIIITTPREVRFFNFWDPAYVKWKVFNSNKHYHFSKQELSTLFINNNLKIIDYYIFGNLKWVFLRWLNVILKYILKTKKQFNLPYSTGFCEWAILVQKNG